MRSGLKHIAILGRRRPSRRPRDAEGKAAGVPFQAGGRYYVCRTTQTAGISAAFQSKAPLSTRSHNTSSVLRVFCKYGDKNPERLTIFLKIVSAPAVLPSSEKTAHCIRRLSVHQPEKQKAGSVQSNPIRLLHCRCSSESRKKMEAAAQ